MTDEAVGLGKKKIDGEYKHELGTKRSATLTSLHHQLRVCGQLGLMPKMNNNNILTHILLTTT